LFSWCTSIVCIVTDVVVRVKVLYRLVFSCHAVVG